MRRKKKSSAGEKPARKVAAQKYRCERCLMTFDTRRKLKLHSHRHIEALKEIEMLRQGKLPDETKDGAEFKGKNRIIIS